jgi:glycosyltransferase involved in cell wall biosynthesis
VICPCRNEEGNIESVVDRLPELGSHTELIFVEGHSSDRTLDKCREVAATHASKDIQVLQQSGKGKGDAVRTGFSAASGDILMILDADLGVAPEDLPPFFDALATGEAEFVNGSRLVYPMEGKAMRFLNLLGNWFFALVFRAGLGCPVKDTLCGTKVLWRSDYERIAANRAYFGEIDPFGDFDLLLGAAKLNLKFAEIPIRYRQRTYGQTHISRFRDAALLFRMSARALFKLRFVDGTEASRGTQVPQR